MKKIFLDTSVISAYFEGRKPDRQVITQKWIQHDLNNYEAFVSNLVIEEIENTSNGQLRDDMLDLIESNHLIVVDVDDEMRALASRYRERAIPDEKNDSIHIATATCRGLEAVASWNFRHMVNLDTVTAIHLVNQENGYGIIEIVSLLQLGGDEYGTL